MRPMCAIYVIVLYVCNICYSVICVQYMLLCLHIYLNTIYLHTSLPTSLLHILYYSQECGQVSDEAHTRMRARDEINET